MAHKRFIGVLNAAQFPLVANLQNRTVVLPRYDANVKTPRAFHGTDESANFNIPQLAYCENVVPTAEGLQSVTFTKVVDGLPGVTDFDQVITLRDSEENNFLFCPAAGKNYIYTAMYPTWTSTNPFPISNTGLVTRAYVNGRTFICYEKLGIYEYDPVTNTFNSVSITGLDLSSIRGIGNSSNYLLAFSDITVYWSSLVDPTDFTPSLTTGAGNGTPQDVKGKIRAVLGISGGFVIYTTRNAVGAMFTNNARSPFIYKEINNSGGIDSYEQVTSEQNAGPHYAWTTGGLQKITLQSAEAVSAEVNDFISGRMWDWFNKTNTSVVTEYYQGIEFPVKVTYVNSRFLVLSYSTLSSTYYNYALIYDTALRRWGKVKFDHVDCFFYTYPNLYGDLSYEQLANTLYDDFDNVRYLNLATGLESKIPSKLAVAFVQSDGSVYILDMNYNKVVNHDAVAIFGKFQFDRSRNIGLQRVTVEGVYNPGNSTPSNFELYAISNWDGYNAAAVKKLTKIREQGKAVTFAGRVIGENVTLVMRGTFALTSYLLEVTEEGRY